MPELGRLGVLIVAPFRRVWLRLHHEIMPLPDPTDCTDSIAANGTALALIQAEWPPELRGEAFAIDVNSPSGMQRIGSARKR